MTGSRIGAFVALSAACVLGATGYVLRAEGSAPSTEVVGVPPATLDTATLDTATLETIGGEAHVVVRDLSAEGTGGVALAALSDPDGRRVATGLSCLRVHMAAGRGLCLHHGGGMFSPYEAVFFDADYQPVGRVELAGIVSRARVSPDGRYGAATVFVSGDSYAEGSFSTRTTIFDMAGAARLGDLEQFDVFRDGKRIDSVDFNFWGVTFAPGDTFYATLATAGHTYLVEGDVATRRMEVLRDGVECPSVSPDGTRIAFKEKVGSSDAGPDWRPAILDLATMESHLLAESSRIDDQIEWLDDATVLYAVDTGEGSPDTFAVAADGSGAARVFLTDADSPAVIRP